MQTVQILKKKRQAGKKTGNLTTDTEWLNRLTFPIFEMDQPQAPACHLPRENTEHLEIVDGSAA